MQMKADSLMSLGEGEPTVSITHAGETRANAIREELDRYVGRGQQTYTPTQLVVEKVEGAHVWTVDGMCLVDMTSGVLVSNLGYAHPKFEKYFQRYMADLPRNAYNMVTEVQAQASKRLVESMGNPKAQKILWAASGSEGIQKSMWAALAHHSDRSIMLATRSGFHGKKGLAADVTGETSKNPNVRFISFPTYDDHPEAFYQAELDALWREHENNIALLITEPYLGAKGSFHPPQWYHQLLQRWCNAHDIPFIFDEVQACFGRTGNMYAAQSYGVEPDLIVLGKGMASGEPAAAVVGRADLIDALDYGEASDTFSGTPMACAAVCATLDVFEEDDVVAHCQKMAKHLSQQLEQLKEQFPFIKAVRGEGLVYGMEMENADIANRCVLEAYRGSGSKGVHFLGPLAQKVVRISPPLVIPETALDEAYALLVEAWKRI